MLTRQPAELYSLYDRGLIAEGMKADINIIDFDMAPLDAVAAPRFHHQWYPDRLFMEPGFSPDTVALLKAMGHDVDVRPRTMGSAQTLVREGALFKGAADPRRPDALALGPRDLMCREGEVACSH